MTISRVCSFSMTENILEKKKPEKKYFVCLSSLISSVCNFFYITYHPPPTMWEAALTDDDIESLLDAPPRVIQFCGRGSSNIRRAAACPVLGMFVECIFNGDGLDMCRLPTLAQILKGQLPEHVAYFPVQNTIAVSVSGTHAFVSKARGPGVVVFDLESRIEITQFGNFTATSALEVTGLTAIVLGCTTAEEALHPGEATLDISRVWIFKGEADFASWSCVRVLDHPIGLKAIFLCDHGALLGVLHRASKIYSSVYDCWMKHMEFVSLCDDTYPDVNRKAGPVLACKFISSKRFQHGHGWIGTWRKPGALNDSLMYWDDNVNSRELTPKTAFHSVRYIMPVPGVGWFIQDLADMFVVVPDALYRIHTMSLTRLAWMVAVVRQSFPRRLK